MILLWNIEEAMKMKKKRFLALCLAGLMLFTGCGGNDETTASGTTSSVTTPQGSIESNPLEGYKAIECRMAESGYQKSSYVIDGTDLFLDLSFPADWFLTPLSGTNGSRYTVDRDGYDIGVLSVGEADDLAAWQVLASRENDYDGVVIQEYIEGKSTGDSVDFRYRYTYTYSSMGNEQTLTLTVDYAEVDEETAFELLENVHLESKDGYTRFGMLGVPKRNEILILGNSFVGSSDIGEILSEMLYKNGKSNTVEAIARGYATVNTYAEDGSLLYDIRNGAYGIVFLCGFYGQTQREVNALGIVKEACDESNTPLVIFPAHNESRGTIKAATEAYPTLKVLDWKAEIDALIDGGVRWSDMCVNDQHSHSKPLAGYVAAHMIYRALFGENPTDTSCGYLLGNQLSLLGDYPKTGCTKEAIVIYKG